MIGAEQSPMANRLVAITGMAQNVTAEIRHFVGTAVWSSGGARRYLIGRFGGGCDQNRKTTVILDVTSGERLAIAKKVCSNNLFANETRGSFPRISNRERSN